MLPVSRELGPVLNVTLDLDQGGAQFIPAQDWSVSGDGFKYYLCPPPPRSLLARTLKHKSESHFCFSLV